MIDIWIHEKDAETGLAPAEYYTRDPKRTNFVKVTIEDDMYRELEKLTQHRKTSQHMVLNQNIARRDALGNIIQDHGSLGTDEGQDTNII
jgi:predicted CopG family antitoxin